MIEEQAVEQGMHLTRSAPAKRTAALAGDPQCSTISGMHERGHEMGDLRVKRPAGGFYQHDPELADAEFAAQVIEEAWYFLRECEAEEQVHGLADATRGQRLLASAYHYVDFVCNVSPKLGDFLESDAGWTAFEVADGLNELGFAAEASALRQTLIGVPARLPVAVSERMKAWEAVQGVAREALIEDLASRLALVVQENRLPAAAAAYIRAHPSEFFVE